MAGQVSRKAYPDDEFGMGDCWQMADFMRKLGLPYPISDDGTILGVTYRLWSEDFPLAPETAGQEARQEPKRPWWRFW